LQSKDEPSVKFRKVPNYRTKLALSLYRKDLEMTLLSDRF